MTWIKWMKFETWFMVKSWQFSKIFTLPFSLLLVFSPFCQNSAQIWARKFHLSWWWWSTLSPSLWHPNEKRTKLQIFVHFSSSSANSKSQENNVKSSEEILSMNKNYQKQPKFTLFCTILSQQSFRLLPLAEQTCVRRFLTLYSKTARWHPKKLRKARVFQNWQQKTKQSKKYKLFWRLQSLW